MNGEKVVWFSAIREIEGIELFRRCFSWNLLKWFVEWIGRDFGLENIMNSIIFIDLEYRDEKKYNVNRFHSQL